MPRNSSGTYTLANGAFAPNTTISSSSVNGDLNDIATALTQSVASTGVTAMTGPLLAADGTVGAPSITLNSNQATGFYKAGANQLAWSANGVQGATFNADTTTTWAGAAALAAGSTMGGNPITNFPSTTAAIFQQTAAPTGWTKVTTSNDVALRIVSGTVGSGGTQALSTASLTVAQANLPNVNWTVTDPGHAHDVHYTNGSPYNITSVTVPVASISSGGGVVGTGAAVTATTGITVASGGSGTAMNFNLKYVDAIICTKN